MHQKRLFDPNRRRSFWIAQTKACPTQPAFSFRSPSHGVDVSLYRLYLWISDGIEISSNFSKGYFSSGKPSARQFISWNPLRLYDTDERDQSAQCSHHLFRSLSSIFTSSSPVDTSCSSSLSFQGPLPFLSKLAMLTSVRPKKSAEQEKMWTTKTSEQTSEQGRRQQWQCHLRRRRHHHNNNNNSRNNVTYTTATTKKTHSEHNKNNNNSNNA